MPQPSKREDLIRSAFQLFYVNGFHATGVDMILAHANISKRTLYKHFPSKDDFIVAVLELNNAMVREKVIDNVNHRASKPEERLLALFDVLEEECAKDTFAGCIDCQAVGEFYGKHSGIMEVCCKTKTMVRDYIASLAQEANLKNPEELSCHIQLLIEGTIVQAHVCKDYKAAGRAKNMAELLLEQHRS